jgi:hypothetical protein
MMNNLKNTLDDVWLSSKQIEEQIKNYNISFLQIRVPEIEFGMKVPIFIYPFYSFLLREDRMPTQNEYWLEYCSKNKQSLINLKLTTQQKLGLKARVFRTYPSLVRDIHFGALLRDCKEFDDVFYNETLDVKYGIDLVVSKNNKYIGLNLFTTT